MKTDKKTFIYGLLLYSIGWIILILNGMRLYDIIGNGLVLGGLFLLGVTISFKLNDANYTEGEKE